MEFQMSSTTSSINEAPRLCVDIDKMLRFSKWLFADHANKVIRGEEQSSDPKANDQSAA
jgi:hypothetical protein